MTRLLILVPPGPKWEAGQPAPQFRQRSIKQHRFVGVNLLELRRELLAHPLVALNGSLRFFQGPV